jgi:hypothetical protein
MASSSESRVLVRGPYTAEIKDVFDYGGSRYLPWITGEGQVEAIDAEGKPFFHILVAESDTEKARAEVIDLLSRFDVEVGEATPEACRHYVSARYEEVERRAIEHYVAELAMGWAKEQERTHQRAHGEEERFTIVFNLRDSYPETSLEVQNWNRRTDKTFVSRWALWKNPEFRKAVEEGFAGIREWLSLKMVHEREG